MNILRKILFGITGLLLIAVVFVIVLRIRWFSFEPQLKNAEAVIESSSGLLVSFDKAASSTALIRLTDGEQQVFKGSWGVNFISPTRTAVFGQFAESPNRQNLFLFDGTGGKQIDISRLSGPVTHVSTNPMQTYLLITGISGVDSYSCVVDITAIPFTCLDVVTDLLGYEKNASGPFIAWWNPEKEHELAIIRGEDAHERFVMDMWDDEKPRPVNHEVIEHLLDRFEARKKTLGSSKFFFKKNGPLLKITDKATGDWYTAVINPFGKVFQTTPNTLVILNGNTAELFNVATKKRFMLPMITSEVELKSYFGDL